MARRHKKGSATAGKFVFRKHLNIGYADALEDKNFLKESYVDTGDLEVLRDLERPEAIVVGRTGAGKTALLLQLDSTEERVIPLVPSDLALTYIANSNTLQFFEAAGVNLDLFYQLLWRHVFAVEVLKKHFAIVDDGARDSFIEWLRERLFGRSAKKEALEYLLDWGQSFWKETDYRVKEITTKLERDLAASLEAKVGIAETDLTAGIGKADALSKEERAEVVQRGQEVVDQVQMAKLSNVMELLDQDLLVDEQKQYFITIDQLDEKWVSEAIRYDLIRALLEAARDFNNRISRVKVIVAVREDLVDRVFRYTRDSGYQEEKFRSLQLHLLWDRGQLEEVLDRRVDQLIREQYTGQPVTLTRLLPDTVERVDSVQYMVDRTMHRPRDMIAFFNECMMEAQGRPRISQEILLKAEGSYSLARLRALADEWSAEYPLLVELCFCMRHFPRHFVSRDIRNILAERLLDHITQAQSASQDGSKLHSKLHAALERGEIADLALVFFRAMYRVGAVGVKPAENLGVHWSYRGHKLVHMSEEVRIHIHPAFHRVLDVVPA